MNNDTKALINKALNVVLILGIAYFIAKPLDPKSWK